MLTISKPLTAGTVSNYFREEYAHASNSYFSESGAIQGQWHGQLAESLGLYGAVTAEAFSRLAEGQDPRTGEQWIRHRDSIKTQAGEEVGHRAGWDLTISAPKTVSLTALVGGDERVRLAHRAAVADALAETERYIQARMGGLTPAKTTGRMLAAAFEHDTARPVDQYPAPQLHTHVILMNMTEDPENGQARSIQPHELFRIQSLVTAVYQNRLESELRKLGYGIERGANHAPEIQGYTLEYRAAESLRSAQIEAEMASKGLAGQESRSLAAHQNREGKLKLTPEELRALHQRHAIEFGNQPARVVAEASQNQGRAVTPENAQGRAQAAVDSARRSLSERNAVFEHYEVVRDALRHTQGRASLEDIYREIDRQKHLGRLREVHHVRPSAPMHRYTTPEQMAVERQTIEMVVAGQKQVASIAVLAESAIAARYSGLNDDQRRLVRDALNTPDQIYGIQGRAGTGKTTALTALRELAEEHGYKTHGLGPTSRAAKGLKEAGIHSETLQAYLTRRNEPARDARRLFFVDETSLASGKQIRDFLLTLTPKDRVLLVGDTRQHESVEAGRIFAQLQDAGMNVAALRKIVRQKDEGLRAVVEAMAGGDVETGVALLGSQNRVRSIPHRGERFEAIAKAFAAQPEGTLVISPDNQSRQELNAAIREELRKTGQLQPDAVRLPVLIPRQELTSEAKGLAESYRVGDSVRYLRGSAGLGLEAKSYAAVLASDPESNRITVKRPDGRAATYDPARLKGVTVYQPEMRSFAVGDRVQFTTPWREKAIATRDMGTVRSIDSARNIRVALDGSERTVEWNFNQNRHLDHAYAMTSHSSQGATVDRALIHVDTSDTRTRALINETLAYVALSRPRHDAQIFTDDETRLENSLSREHRNTTALTPEQTTSIGIGI